MSTPRRHAFTHPTPGVPERYRQDVEQALQARVVAEEDLETSISTAASGSSTDLATHIADTTTHGISAFGATLVDDASADAALTTLGVSTFAKTVLDDTTAGAFRTTLGLVAIASSGSAVDLSAGIIPDARMPDLTGDVTTSEGAVATTIANDAVTNAKLANMAARTVKCRAANSSGDPGDEAGAGTSTDAQVFSDDGTTLAFRSLSSLDSTMLRWVEVRSIDFASWTATDFSGDADGTTHSLNGGDGALTWTTQSAANANSASGSAGFFRRNNSDTGDDSGNGLRISHDQSASTSIIRATQTGPRLTVPLNTLIPNFSPFIEYRFELQINRFLDVSTAPTNITATMAVYQAAGTPTGSSARFAGVGFTRNGASNGAPTIIAGNNTRLPVTASTHTYATGTSFAHNVVGMVLSPSNVAAGYSADYASGWPADTACRAIGSTSEAFPNSATSPLLDENCVLEIGVGSNASAAGTVDVMFRRLRVLRRIR